MDNVNFPLAIISLTMLGMQEVLENALLELCDHKGSDASQWLADVEHQISRAG